MSALPYMKLYCADFITATTELSAEEGGAYLFILMQMWLAGGSLPNDPKKLARVAHVDTRRWPKVWAEIAHYFDVEGDEITQRRLQKEALAAQKIAAVRSTAGRAGGLAKSQKNKDTGVADANRVPEHPSGESQQTRARSKFRVHSTEDREDKPLYPSKERPDGLSKGSRLSPDWKPTEADTAYATEAGFDRDRIKRTAENFRDYWVAVPGAKGVKLDWSATWRTWVRRDADRNPVRKSGWVGIQ